MEYETLHVQMFGKFVMHYGNTPVALKKQGSAKTVRMLQMVLLAGDEGIPKQELIDTLYEWTDPGETISRSTPSVTSRPPFTSGPMSCTWASCFPPIWRICGFTRKVSTIKNST